MLGDGILCGEDGYQAMIFAIQFVSSAGHWWVCCRLLFSILFSWFILRLTEVEVAWLRSPFFRTFACTTTDWVLRGCKTNMFQYFFGGLGLPVFVDSLLSERVGSLCFCADPCGCRPWVLHFPFLPICLIPQASLVFSDSSLCLSHNCPVIILCKLGMLIGMPALHGANDVSDFASRSTRVESVC